MIKNFEVIVGTYEEFLLGYKIVSTNETIQIKQSFADKSHSGALKCIAVGGHWIATGGSDNRIFIYDMTTRKRRHTIYAHEGTINALVFTPENTHLFSGGSDGHIIAISTKSWSTAAHWKKAHNGAAVTHIICHPSGKLALSLGSDFILRSWNLVKGTIAYKTNLKSRNSQGLSPGCLVWSQNGNFFTVCWDHVVDVWSNKHGNVKQSFEIHCKANCVIWLSDISFLVGVEDGKIYWLSLNDVQNQTKIVKAHDDRLKTMSFCKNILVTAASSGHIKLWHLDETNREFIEVCTTNIGCRPTCIAIFDSDAISKNSKEKSTNTT